MVVCGRTFVAFVATFNVDKSNVEIPGAVTLNNAVRYAVGAMASPVTNVRHVCAHEFSQLAFVPNSAWNTHCEELNA